MQPYEQWPASIRELEGQFTLIVLSNTLHITPWECSVGLFNGAAKLLSPGGQLAVYGPFKVDGKFVGADGGANNEKFDEKLRSTNESWGIRDVDDLKAVATPLAAGCSTRWTCRPTTSRSRSSNSDVNLLALTQR